MEFKDHPLWAFTLAAHERKGVHEACVEMQETFDIDVNFLFWCCWKGSVGALPLNEDQMDTALSAVGDWQDDIVRPIWKARWKLKPGYGGFPQDDTEPLRKQLVAAEVYAEHLELLLLAEVVKTGENPLNNVRHQAENAVKNVNLYLVRHFRKPKKNKSGRKGDEMVADNIKVPLARVLWACFQELSREQAFELVEQNVIKEF